MCVCVCVCVCYCACILWFSELFLDLALDNAALHGGGDTRVDCYFENGTMRIDVNNKIADAENAANTVKKKDRLQHREFSTCLGNHDLILVCSKRKIPFEVLARITVTALNIRIKHNTHSHTERERERDAKTLLTHFPSWFGFA